MKILNWLNHHSVAVFMALALVGICVLAHFAASSKMSLVSDHFPVMNPRTEHNIALINFMNEHWWLAGGYAILFTSSLLFLELRNAPRWSIWLVFLIMAAPCVVYLKVCAYIAGKFVF